MPVLKYNAIQIDHLAAEYVLGTLHAGARRRFEQLITDRADVRFAVWRWERHLNAFASGILPHAPRRRVWQQIQRRIDLPRRSTMSASTWWQNLRVAVPAAIAAAWLAVVLLPTQNTDRMAIFADQDAAAQWVISADLDRGVLRTEPVAAKAAAADTSYELWLLPTEGAPLSLGLLSVSAGAVEIPLSAHLAKALGTAANLAISREPLGGSPTGLPTGPILYKATLVKI